MSRFYERYGLSIVWSLTSIAGIVLLYWIVVKLALWELLPPAVGVHVTAIHNVVAAVVAELMRYIEAHIQWFGAIATLGTFVFGLVTGISQARRQLPRRLMQFMEQQRGPVYDNSEAIVRVTSFSQEASGSCARRIGWTL
jgi:hypothetical protein